MENTKELTKNQTQNSVQRSEKDVAQLSTPSEEISYNQNMLRAAFAVIAALSYEIHSPTSLELAKAQVKHMRPRDIDEETWDELLNVVFEVADKIRGTNPIARALF